MSQSDDISADLPLNLLSSLSTNVDNEDKSETEIANVAILFMKLRSAMESFGEQIDFEPPVTKSREGLKSEEQGVLESSNRLKQQLAETELKLNSKREKLKERKIALSCLSTQYNESISLLNSNICRINKENKCLTERMQQLEELLETHKKSADLYQNMLSTLERSVEMSQKNIQEVAPLLDKYSSTVTELRNKLSTLVHINETNEELFRQCESHINSLYERLKSKESAKIELSQKMTFLQESNDNLHSSLYQKTATINDQQKRIEQKKLEYKKLMDMLEQKSFALKETKKQISELEKENSSLNESLHKDREVTNQQDDLILLEEQKLRIVALQDALIEERSLVSKLKEEARSKHEFSVKQLQKLQAIIDEKTKKEQELTKQLHNQKMEATRQTNHWTQLLPAKRLHPEPISDADEISEEEMYADDLLDLGDALYGTKKRCSSCNKQVITDSLIEKNRSRPFVCRICTENKWVS